MLTELTEWLQSASTEDSEGSALLTDAVVDEVSAQWIVIGRFTDGEFASFLFETQRRSIFLVQRSLLSAWGVVPRLAPAKDGGAAE